MPNEQIDNCEQLKEAVARAKGSNDEGEKRYLIKRSIDLGCVEHIPDDWTVEVDNGH